MSSAIGAIVLAAQAPWKHQQLTAFTVLFEILSKFALNKMPLASNVYKCLSFSITRYYNNEGIREFLLSNMKIILEENENIPIEI